MGLCLTSSIDLPDYLVDDDVVEWPHLRTQVMSVSYGTFAGLRADVATVVLKGSPYSHRSFIQRKLRRGRDLPALPAGAVPFWYHSDCEGSWTAAECLEVSELLGEYLSHELNARYVSLATHLAYCLFYIGDNGGTVQFG
jgi:hypothetical protein